MSVSDLRFVLAARVEARPPDPPPVAVLLPDEDLGADNREGSPLGYAEGQSFAIEYVDSVGQRSRRRITVFDIRANDAGVPYLVARCHERKATRTFRVDRIVSCIDYDGEVHDDVPAFLHETFGMAFRAASAAPTDAERRWAAIKGLFWADAVLLMALSRADHRVHSAEVETALRHLAGVVERAGTMLSEDEVAAIQRFMRRLRPNEDTIGRALEQLSMLSPEHIKRTLIAGTAVVDADGQRHPAEMRLINQLAFELLGVELF